MRRIVFLTGFAAGYVLGARGGRGHYEKIKSMACTVKDSQAAHTALDTAGATGGKLLHTAMDHAPGWVPGSHATDDTEKAYVNGNGARAHRP